jgi:hypothetical protein
LCRDGHRQDASSVQGFERSSNYFDEFEERAKIGDVQVRSWYSGFKSLNPQTEVPVKPEGVYVIELAERQSLFDDLYPGLPAQYAKEDGTPKLPWAKVTTTLSDIDTSQLHWVKIPRQHIVIDFDLVNEDGDKDIDFNLAEASKWPATYAEVSKSGSGIHLHYIYSGDVEELASIYDVGIEVKTLLGNNSLRRKYTRSNNVNITPLDGGLPKKEKPVLADKSIQSEKGLRELIARNLRKEIHGTTKPSVDFIKKILDDAYSSGMAYDVRDMRSAVLTFAAKSTHQALVCMDIVKEMKFVSESDMTEVPSEGPIVIFDVEVYSNLLVVCWKQLGKDQVVRMINPKPEAIGELFKFRLVGFNNRRYDNHILYARYLGLTLEEIYKISDRMINGESRSAFYGEAYNLSYTDIYDFSSEKKSLKVFEIDLGIHHMELDLPYDKPVPEELWDKVVDYCVNDVVATEAVWNSRKQDFVARQILAELSGLTVNQTTAAQTAKIIFGNDKNPQRSFVYTDLSQEFPGYNFDGKESTYRGEVTGEGGYVYAEPGHYRQVALLDVASMHPTSIECLNLFGPFTERFAELKAARMAIKSKDYELARRLLDGKLGKFIEDDDLGAEALAYALKIVINTVYGLTSARFDNPFRDVRNKDNIVAKRGALFMIDLKHAVQGQGYSVAHIKTDSIKIPDASQEIIEEITQFGAKYGYDFVHEFTYDKFCLIDKAQYIARYGWHATEPEKVGTWEATGAQFAHPYVFKQLFSHEEIVFDDLCETKQVMKGSMYLDFEHDRPNSLAEGMQFVGRSGRFIPVRERGGVLYRVITNDVGEEKKFAVTGTKGHLWLEAEMAKGLRDEIDVDMSYFDDLISKSYKDIEKHAGDFQTFIG